MLKYGLMLGILGLNRLASEEPQIQREIQIENDHVRVWKTTIPPHHILKMHRHDSNRVIVGLEGGTLLKIEETGEESNLEFESGQAYWLEKDPEGAMHADVNCSDRSVVVMVIELKSS